MKKITAFLMTMLAGCCGAYSAQADLIQGDFSGIIDINGSISELNNGALFSGQFIYDTDAVAVHTDTMGPNSRAVVSGAFVELSVALTGINATYSCTFDGPWQPLSTVSYSNAGPGTYGIDFDGISGGTGFIEDLELAMPPELVLEFDNTDVTDPNSPLIMPNAADLIPGTSYWGSVLYLWVMDFEGVNQSNGQINCNIASLSMQPYQQPAPSPVPEPATAILFATGMMGIVGIRSKKEKE